MDGVRVGCSELPDGSLVLYIVTVAQVLGLRIVVSKTLRRHSASCCGSGNQVHPSQCGVPAVSCCGSGNPVMPRGTHMVLYEVSSVFLLLNLIAHWALLRLSQRVDQDPLTHLRQASEHLSSRTARAALSGPSDSNAFPKRQGTAVTRQDPRVFLHISSSESHACTLVIRPEQSVHSTLLPALGSYFLHYGRENLINDAAGKCKADSCTYFAAW